MSASPPVLELAEPPSLAVELLRAAVARRPARPGEVPRLEVRVRHFTPDPRQLALYREVCGFPADGHLPLPFPQVLAAPLHLALLNRPEFPYRLLGMIHVRNHIQQYRRLAEGASLSVLAWVEGQREVRLGRELDLHTHVEEGGVLVWSAVTTMLRRLPGTGERPREERPAGSTAAASEEDALFAQSRPAPWTVSEDTGRRYARASGDYNPIHLHALSARLFGFPRAIAHGMWTVGRCVAEMGEAAEAPALTLSSVFRRPLLLPSRVVFQTAEQRDGAIAYRVKSEDGQPHVMGELTHLPSPEGRWEIAARKLSAHVPRDSPSRIDLKGMGHEEMKMETAVSIPGARWFRIASWMHVMVALGHMIGNFGPGRQVPTPEESQVYESMAQLTMRFPGPRHTLMDFATGWSVSMGLLYLGFGAVNLTLEHVLRKEGRGVPAAVSVVNVLVSLAGLIVAALYFSPPPLPFLAAAVSCFGVAAARSRQAAR